MGVASGSPVTASNTNQAFIDANTDDQTIGKLDLSNTDPASGPSVINVQREINSLDSFTGRTSGSVYNSIPAWVSTDAGTPSDNLTQRSEALTSKFNLSTGHSHDGSAASGAPIQSASIVNVQLKGYMIDGTDLIGATGSSIDVSTEFTLKTPSSSATVKGVVVNAPYNKVPLWDSNLDFIKAPGGDIVYGRLTESSGVWTLSFYYLNASVETVYSFPSAYDVKWKYQELYNPIADPNFNYSDWIFAPSDNATADVIDATELVYGKVIYSNAAPPAIASAGAKGGSIQKVAYGDHTHEGVHAVKAFGQSDIYGDVTFKAGAGISLNQTGSQIEIVGTTAVVSYQEGFSNPVNGVNDTFGPLTNTVATADSILVVVDGVVQENTHWSLVSQSVVFGASYIPQTGQKVYVYYLTTGSVTPPPAPTGTVFVEYFTLSSTDATNKYVTVSNTPASPARVMLDVIGGTAQEFNVDFTVVSNQIRWNGYALDGILTTGDKLRVWYQS